MVDITITKAEYIKDYYYIEFKYNDKDYTTTYKAVRGTDIDKIKANIEKALILKETGVNINSINLIEDLAPEPQVPTEKELQEEKVMKLKNEKDRLKNELIELQEYAKRYLDSIGLLSNTTDEIETLKSNLLSDIDKVTADFNAKLIEYRTEKQILDNM